MNCQVYNSYEKIYNSLKNSDDWKLVDTKNIEIQNLSCEIQHFFFSLEQHKKGNGCNTTFFFVNNVIIGIAYDYCEDITIFGESYF